MVAAAWWSPRRQCARRAVVAIEHVPPRRWWSGPSRFWRRDSRARDRRTGTARDHRQPASCASSLSSCTSALNWPAAGHRWIRRRRWRRAAGRPCARLVLRMQPASAIAQTTASSTRPRHTPHIAQSAPAPTPTPSTPLAGVFCFRPSPWTNLAAKAHRKSTPRRPAKEKR